MKNFMIEQKSKKIKKDQKRSKGEKQAKGSKRSYISQKEENENSFTHQHKVNGKKVWCFSVLHMSRTRIKGRMKERRERRGKGKLEDKREVKNGFKLRNKDI